jgi:hypothetical protein
MRGWTADLAKLEGSMKMWEYMRDTYTPESAFGRHAREMLEKNEPRRASLKVVTLKDGYEHNGGYSY